MEMRELQKHIRTLLKIRETRDPVISAYLNTEAGPARAVETFDDRIERLRRAIADGERPSFEDAADRIGAWLGTQVHPDTKGVAIFARSGAIPFFLPLQLRVPLSDWVGIGDTPCVYYLVKARQRYGRYLVAFCTADAIRILEVSLGVAVAQESVNRADVHEPSAGEPEGDAARSRYRESVKQMVRQAAERLKRWVIDHEREHVVLAGDARIRVELVKQLPGYVLQMVIDSVPASSDALPSDVVGATLESYLAGRHREAHAKVGWLHRQLQNNGMAVAGSADSLRALGQGCVDVLLLAREHHPIEKAQLVRLAEQQGSRVEIVEGSDLLMQLGGVGCLLRHPLARTLTREPDEIGEPSLVG